MSIIENEIRKMRERVDGNIVGIAVAAFGFVDMKNGIVLSSGSVKDWSNVPLKSILENSFGVPVYVENDVKAALAGESILMEDTESAVYLSIGSNIGMAYQSGGIVYHGAHGRFGEICNYQMKNENRTLGELLGGWGISRQYREQTGIKITAKEVYQKMLCGDRVAEEVYMRMTMNTAEVIRWLELCFDPTYLILGGGLICNNDDLFQMIKKRFQMLTVDRKDLESARYGEKSGIYGGARLLLSYLNVKL